MAAMIPSSMQAVPRWVTWQYEYRDGKRTKVLHSPGTGARASSTDPSTWTTYEEATRVRDHYAGIGFVLGDGWIGVDWDHVRNPATGEWDTGVLDEILSLGTYAEVSPSGTGAHAILLGDALPGNRSRKGDGPEFYASGRFFTVTGDHVEGTPDDAQTPPPGALETLYRRYIPEGEEQTPAPAPTLPGDNLSDDEIITRAERAKNGATFSRLFHGDWSGYPSQSEADSALCFSLAFWTQDPQQIDRIFRRSGLHRGKWDREDYRNRTIGQAIARTRETYSPRKTWLGENRPEIKINNRELPEITTEAISVLQKYNTPDPTIFVRSRQMIRVSLDERDHPVLETMSEAAIRGLLARVARWVIVKPAKKPKPTKKPKLADDSKMATEDQQKISFESFPTEPPLIVVRDLMSIPEWKHLPPIVGVTTSPIFHVDGSIRDNPGYDATTRLFYQPDTRFYLPGVPQNPSTADVAGALNLIREVFIDFPFCDDADRANAYAALFTAVLRPCIDGSVPLYLVDKPQAGAGAGLLQRTIGLIALGQEPPLRTLPATAEEMRKEIFTTLRSANPIQIYDNIEGRLRSPELAAILTAKISGGRVLGTIEELSLPVRCFWLCNGNNVQIGGDLARRTFRTRIDPQMAMPWQREKFKHENLESWVISQRGQILTAIYTITRSWIRAGKPLPSKEIPRVGSFEPWRDMIGGIMEHAGVRGFLANADDVYLDGDADRVQWEAFLAALWDWTRANPFTTSALGNYLRDESNPRRWEIINSLPDYLADAFASRKNSFSRVLGNAFSRQNGRHFPGGWCLRRGRVEHHAQTWVITYAPRTATGEFGGVSESGNICPDNKTDAQYRDLAHRGEFGEFPPPYPTREKVESLENIYHIENRRDETPLTPQQKLTPPKKSPDDKTASVCGSDERGVWGSQTPPDPREHMIYSPDPADYQHLPRPDFGQRCAACGKAGVTHREKSAVFNRRRGTAALCDECFKALGTDHEANESEPVVTEGA